MKNPRFLKIKDSLICCLVIKIIFGKVIRFPVCLVGFIIFTVTVILELVLVHSRLLFRAHDLEVIA